MKHKSTKSALLMSFTSLLLCFAMLIGCTFAWFTDTATAAVSVIKSGKLDVEITYDNDSEISGKLQFKKIDASGNPDTTTPILWEPGCNYELPALKIKNVGNLAFKYYVILDKDSGVTTKISDGSRADVDLLDALEFTATIGESSTPIDGFKGKLYPLGNCPTGGETEITLKISAKMKESAGNEYQDLSLDGIRIMVVATQLEHEYDSYRNTYDANATLPPLPERLNGSAKSGGIRRTTGANAESTVTVTEDGAAQVDATEQESVKIEVKKEVGTEQKTVIGADVPAPAAIKVMNDTFKEENGFTTPTTGQSVDDVLVMTLNVKTLDASTSSIKVDVSLLADATRTITEDGKEDIVETKSGNVTELSQAVTVVLQLDKNLEDVKVTHTHGTEEPVEFSSEGVTDAEGVTEGKFFYEKATGKLTLKTTKFSEFDVQFTRVEVARIGNEGFTTLQDAFDAAKSDDTVEVMKTSADEAIVVNKNVNLNLQAVDAAKVKVENAVVTLTGKGKLEAEVAGTLNIVGGSYEELKFVGEGDTLGKVNLVNVTTEKLVTAKGTNIKLDVKGGLVKDTEFKGKVTLTVEGGKFENFDVLQNENVSVDFKGGEFHLETPEEKAAFEADLTNTQCLYQTGDGWYGVAACSYSPKDVTSHIRRYTVDGVTHQDTFVHEFDANDVCTKCGFSQKIGKVQIHIGGGKESIVITDANKNTVDTSFLDGAITFNPGNNTFTLEKDVSLQQIDFTCDETHQGSAILDLNGHILTCNFWSALDIYDLEPNKIKDGYGYDGYNLTINDSNPTAEHEGYITYFKNGYSWITADKKDSVAAGTTIEIAYPISGGIIMNENGMKYGSGVGDPYDGAIISTVGKTTLTMNGGTLAGGRSDGDIGGICMNRSYAGGHSVLFMNGNSAVVACSAAAGGVEGYNTDIFMNDSAHISYCVARNGGYYPGGAVAMHGGSKDVVFVMSEGCKIDHCVSREGAFCTGDGAVVYADGNFEGTITLNGSIDSCEGRTMIWPAGKTTLEMNSVSFKNCVCSGAVTCWQSTSSMTVTGNSIFEGCTFGWNELFDQNGAKTVVKGGDYTKIPDTVVDMFGTDTGVVISGGTFNAARQTWVEAHLESGCSIVDNGNGTFTVE